MVISFRVPTSKPYYDTDGESSVRPALRSTSFSASPEFLAPFARVSGLHRLDLEGVVAGRLVAVAESARGDAEAARLAAEAPTRRSLLTSYRTREA